jgi:hypothetical protein
MTSFYFVLALVNIGCFMPLYLLNVRAAPNPVHGFLKADRSRRAWLLRVLYIRPGSTDPFRIHFDFTFFVLLATAFDATGPIAKLIATLLLAFGFLEILYTSTTQSIFRRAPALASDLSLLRNGIGLARRQVYWMAPLFATVLLMVWLASAASVSALFDQDSPTALSALTVAGILLPPCVYHCTRHYVDYLWREVYSASVHLFLNVRFDALVKRLGDREVAFYQRLNDFQHVTFSTAPNVVVVCVESYGSIVFRDPRFGAGVGAQLRSHEAALVGKGYKIASTFSEAPLFAGGSWLSYASFAYGTSIPNGQLYDAFFSRPTNFGAYESLFHVLRRNGYENVLLCPLGGVDSRTVDWDTVDRCFHPQLRIGFDDLQYVGPTVNFFGVVRLHAALDQFALNFGYERALQCAQPFSLFFCTLNSHYPWHSPAQAVDDWRALNTPARIHEQHRIRSPIDRYNAAIRYQLDYTLRFAADRAADAPLIILFGDHQPPIITPEEMGKATPFHVLSRDQALIDVFLSHGFLPKLDLTAEHPRPIRHEGALSLIMKAMQAAYGTEPQLEVPYRAHGAQILLEEMVLP